PLKLLQQYYPWLIAAGILGVIIGVVTYFGLALTLPRYDAVADFRVFPEPEDPGDAANRAGGSAGGQDEMETFMETQVLVMKSDQILKKVIEERAFRDTKWSQQFLKGDGQIDPTDALIELKKIVSARRIPDTQVIRLPVRTPAKHDSTATAQTTSVVFLDFVKQLATRDLRDLIQLFEAQLRTLREDIANIDARIETLFSRAQMTSLQAESSVWANEVRTLQPELVKVRSDLTQ